MKYLIITACFGDRSKWINPLISNILSFFPDIDIQIYCDKIYNKFEHPRIKYIEVENIWPGHPRSGIRNSNYYKVLGALAKDNQPYDEICLLDDDMKIMSSDFLDGFKIASKFGIAVPVNPRVYVKYNAMGADMSPKDLEDIKDIPPYLPACNYSPCFFNPQHEKAKVFMDKLLKLLKDNPCRGTMEISKAAWQTGFSPVYLPEQWCVCGENARYWKDYNIMLRGKTYPVDIMAVHLGHKEVRDVFVD